MLPLLNCPPRLIGFEVGQGQARDVAALLEAAGYGSISSSCRIWPASSAMSSACAPRARTMGRRLAAVERKKARQNQAAEHRGTEQQSIESFTASL